MKTSEMKGYVGESVRINYYLATASVLRVISLK